MKKFIRRKLLIQSGDRKGAMLPLVAIILVVLFVSCVFAIDLARIHVTRSELRTATDAAARAGVEALSRARIGDDAIALAQEAAIDTALLNQVAGQGLVIDEDNLQFGFALQNSDGTFTFNEDENVISSVRVVGQLDQGLNMMFGPLFGRNTVSPVQLATATRLDRDIALVLDVSGSMSTDGRFQALNNALDVFVGELNKSSSDEQLSLTVYESRATKIADLTTDFQGLKRQFQRRRPGGATAIGRGMQLGLDSLESDGNRRAAALKSMVVMTDGNHNTGKGPVGVAVQCARKDVIVNTITFSDGADQRLMKRVAEKGGGIHLHATNNEELVGAFETIAKSLQVLLID